MRRGTRGDPVAVRGTCKDLARLAHAEFLSAAATRPGTPANPIAQTLTGTPGLASQGASISRMPWKKNLWVNPDALAIFTLS